MSDDLNKWLNLSSPLGEETKKTRRNLLIAAVACLLIGYTGQLPTQLAILGIKFNEGGSNPLGLFLFLGDAYFCLYFLSCGTLDFLQRHKDQLIAREKGKLWKEKYAEIYEKLFGSCDEEASHNPESDKDDIIQNGEQVLLNSWNLDAEEKVSAYLKGFKGFFWMRMFLDLGLPLMLGLFGLYKLFFVIVIDIGIHGCFSG